ncbi:MAG: hypothetical protein EOO77_14990 [Oxalobacteraceae bacterium]|nr:MAG: hypothetical protein EOO77_14990 [Oxalobacteraceae bacterium]
MPTAILARLPGRLAPVVGLGLAGLATSARTFKAAKDANYPDHVPLNMAQNALFAVGSGVMGVLDTTRGGKLVFDVFPGTRAD